MEIRDTPPKQNRLGGPPGRYQVSTDKRSGITNDPNRPDDPEYILRLIGQVIAVSLDTVRIVNSLPEFIISEPALAANQTG